MDPRTAFLINTRGNPDRLVGVCCALSDTAARPDLITFAIRADDDDPETIAAVHRLAEIIPGAVKLFVGTRPLSLGAEINHMAANTEADTYHVINDDTWPLTRFWDACLAQHHKDNPVFMSCWMLAGPTAPDYPIVSRQWLDANDGKLFTDHFPYWFDDRWLGDVACLLTGDLIHPLPIWLCAHKKGTQRMRDFPFWVDFFMAHHQDRIDQAQRMANKMNLNLDIRRDRADWIHKTWEWHGDLVTNAETIQQKNADSREPDAAYLEAKARAEAILARRVSKIATEVAVV